MREDVVFYFEQFYKIKGAELSDKAAYYRVESWWLSNYGFQKYTSFGSFRVMKYRYLKHLRRVSLESKQS